MADKDYYTLPKRDKIAEQSERPVRRGLRRSQKKPGMKTLKDRLFSHVRSYRQEKIWSQRDDGFWRKWSLDGMKRHAKFIRELAQQIKDKNGSFPSSRSR